MLTITVDFDSDKVRIYNEKDSTLIDMEVRYPSKVLAVLVEVLNALEPTNVTLETQNEGQRRTIDEY